MVEDGKTPYLPVKDLDALGFAIAIYPVSALLATAQRLDDVYSSMLAAGCLPNAEPRLSFQTYNKRIGLNSLVPNAID